jgi:hypothetical protein
MDETILSAVMTTFASVLAVGVVILEDIRSRRLLRREHHVNREYERGIYMGFIWIVFFMEVDKIVLTK